MRVLVPGSDLGQDWIEPDYALGTHGETWMAPSPGGVGYDTQGDYDGLIGTDVEADMHGRNASAFVRAEFEVEDPAQIDRLHLRVQYDDGFAAFLNGQLVATRNSPATGDISPPTGLLTYYDFENTIDDRASLYANGSGNKDDDLTAVAASGAVSVSYDTGVVGQAVRISRNSGEAALLRAQDSNDLDLGSSWTVEAFVKPDSANANEWDRFATK